MSIFATRCPGLAIVALLVFAPSIAASAPLQMVVLSTGQGPKTPLRIQPRVGTTQTMVITTRQKMSMTMAKMALPQRDLPPTRVTIALKVLSVDGGRIRASFETIDVDVTEAEGLPPGVADGLRASLIPLKSLKGQIELNDRGQVVSTDLPAATAPATEQQTMINDFYQNLTRLVVPLPEVPVGVGARWKVIDTPSKLGVSVKQEIFFTLAQRSGQNLVLSTEAVMTVDGGPVSMPNMPPGVQTTAKSTRSTGQGQTQVDLNKLAAQGHVDMNVDFAMDMKQGGQSETMAMSLKMNMRVAEK